MAINVVLDQVTNLSMKEVNGVVRRMTTLATMVGPELGQKTDYSILCLAYKQVGLPLPGQGLTAPLLSPTGDNAPLAMLVLAEREFKLGGDKNEVNVLMEFQHFMDGDNQNLSPQALRFDGNKMASSPIVFGRNRASVQQLKSNFITNKLCLPNGFPVPAWVMGGSYLRGAVVDYKGVFWVSRVVIDAPEPPAADLRFAPPPGPPPAAIGTYWDLAVEGVDVFPLLNPDANGIPQGERRQITVGHQFPGNDPDVAGQTKYQTGEITIMQPNENFKLHGQVFVRNPRTIKKALTGAINSVPWMDAGAYEWMCTEVSWEPLFPEVVNLDHQYGQWKMSFEFQHNEDTWLPTAIFNDQRTGRPPADLVPDFGYRVLHKQPEVDFAQFFMLTFGCIPEAGA